MKLTSSLFSFTFFLLFFFLFFTFFHKGNASDNLIYETCKKCAENDPNLSLKFCITSLQAARHSHQANLHQLGFISINLIHRNVTSTRRLIGKLLKNKKNLDPFTKSCLEDCLELYSDAVPTIGQAKRDYRDKRYDDANIDVGSVTDASTTCEDGFHDKEGVVSPLTKRNNDTFQLTAIALSIINMFR